jgi:hypothetical protein
MGLGMEEGRAFKMWVGRQEATRRWAEEESARAAEASAALSAKRPNSAPDMTDSDLQQPTPTSESGSGQS